MSSEKSRIINCFWAVGERFTETGKRYKAIKVFFEFRLIDKGKNYFLGFKGTGMDNNYKISTANVNGYKTLTCKTNKNVRVHFYLTREDARNVARKLNEEGK